MSFKLTLNASVLSLFDASDYLEFRCGGPGFPIPPTRTPWASWWSQRAQVANRLFPKNGIIEFYVPWIMPDVAKENPQPEYNEDDYPEFPPLEVVGTVKVKFVNTGPLKPWPIEEDDQ